jgi:di/tricarboxylate transporter
MGAGGYKPSDYPRVGLGLTVLVFTLILLLV